MSLLSSDQVVFFRSLLRNPATVGSVIPSSRELSQLMVSQVDPNSSGVLEIGAGTGPVTNALLEHGIEPERLLVIERDPKLAAHLRGRFPSIRLVCGDALHADRILASQSMAPVKTILSSLPMRNLDRLSQTRIIRSLLKTLAPAGQLIQFTYALGCPIPSRRLGLHAECLGRVWRNVPPAAVWRFTLDGRKSASAWHGHHAPQGRA